MKHLFDHKTVQMIDVDGVDISFIKDGKTYKTVGQAYHSSRPRDQHQTYQQALMCVDDDDFEGMLFFDIIDDNPEDEANACNWNKFDVHQHW